MSEPGEVVGGGEPRGSGDHVMVEHPLNLPSRTEEEERLVRFAYYAWMASNDWERHPAAASLLQYGYDVKAELKELASWLVAERRRLFQQENARGSET